MDHAKMQALIDLIRDAAPDVVKRAARASSWRETVQRVNEMKAREAAFGGTTSTSTLWNDGEGLTLDKLNDAIKKMNAIKTGPLKPKPQAEAMPQVTDAQIRTAFDRIFPGLYHWRPAGFQTHEMVQGMRNFSEERFRFEILRAQGKAMIDG